MSHDDPKFIACAMEASEQGIKAEAIEEECACRLGLSISESSSTNLIRLTSNKE